MHSARDGLQAHGVPNGGGGTTNDYLLDEGSLVAEVMGGVTAAGRCHHHQAVDEVAPGLIVTGRTADGTVEVLELASYPAILACVAAGRCAGVVPQSVLDRPLVKAIADALPIALLMALVAVQTFAVDQHLEDPAVARVQRGVQLVAELPLELDHQTGGPRVIVSARAVVNVDLHGPTMRPIAGARHPRNSPAQRRQLVAAIIQQFGRTHAARNQHGILRQMAVAGLFARQMAQQPPRQIVARSPGVTFQLYSALPAWIWLNPWA